MHKAMHIAIFPLMVCVLYPCAYDVYGDARRTISLTCFFLLDKNETDNGLFRKEQRRIFFFNVN